MLMRLVKCYLMEQFNQARVERQLAQYAQRPDRCGIAARRSISRSWSFSACSCALVLLFVAG